jgi:hypothetical protein
MTDAKDSLETQALDERIEVRGRLSRTEWELVYVAARKFAQAHGLSISHFDLQSAEINEQETCTDVAPIARSVAGGEV